MFKEQLIVCHTLEFIITYYADTLISNLDVYDPGISDHSAVSLMLALPKPPLKKEIITFLKTKSINTDEFTHTIGDFVLSNDFDCTLLTETWPRNDDSDAQIIRELTPRF